MADTHGRSVRRKNSTEESLVLVEVFYGFLKQGDKQLKYKFTSIKHKSLNKLFYRMRRSEKLLSYYFPNLH